MVFQVHNRGVGADAGGFVGFVDPGSRKGVHARNKGVDSRHGEVKQGKVIRPRS